MLTEWTLGNFKSISNKTVLSLAPLTILVGENSSGKSSILQSILLLSQTLRATNSIQPIVLNGEFTLLGYMSDVVNEDQQGLPLEIGFVLESQEANNQSHSLKAKTLFNMTMKSAARENNKQAQGVLENVYLQNSEDLVIIERLHNKRSTVLDENENSEMYIPVDLRRKLDTGVFDYVVRKIGASSGMQLTKTDLFDWHISTNHFLPDKVLETYDAYTSSCILALKAGSEYLDPRGPKRDSFFEPTLIPLVDVLSFKKSAGSRFRHDIHWGLDQISLSNKTLKEREKSLESSWRNTIRLAENSLDRSTSYVEWIESIKKEFPLSHARNIARGLFERAITLETGPAKDLSNESVGVRDVDLPTSLSALVRSIVEYFSHHVYYLGPLRDDPRFLYALPPYPEVTHVGLKGEFTASVLESYKEKQIEYPCPPRKDDGVIEVRTASLKSALDAWLVYLGLLDGETTESRGKMGTELTVHSIGVKRQLDLTSIGVGVSQVLPTLVMGLIAPPGTTFLLEQPELHLHPKVQSMVADFLLGLTKVGKQCIVETHSEYLVNRLRRRVAEDDADVLAKDVSIYFVERRQGKSVFRRLDLNQYGALLDWPDGFFDEGPNEAELIMRAALKKHQRKQEAQHQ